jgi:hypothetical protein
MIKKTTPLLWQLVNTELLLHLPGLNGFPLFGPRPQPS